MTRRDLSCQSNRHPLQSILSTLWPRLVVCENLVQHHFAFPGQRSYLDLRKLAIDSSSGHGTTANPRGTLAGLVKGLIKAWGLR
jgi:hypothetical protein